MSSVKRHEFPNSRRRNSSSSEKMEEDKVPLVLPVNPALIFDYTGRRSDRRRKIFDKNAMVVPIEEMENQLFQSRTTVDQNFVVKIGGSTSTDDVNKHQMKRGRKRKVSSRKDEDFNETLSKKTKSKNTVDVDAGLVSPTSSTDLIDKDKEGQSLLSESNIKEIVKDKETVEKTETVDECLVSEMVSEEVLRKIRDLGGVVPTVCQPERYYGLEARRIMIPRFVQYFMDVQWPSSTTYDNEEFGITGMEFIEFELEDRNEFGFLNSFPDAALIGDGTSAIVCTRLNQIPTDDLDIYIIRDDQKSLAQGPFKLSKFLNCCKRSSSSIIPEQ